MNKKLDIILPLISAIIILSIGIIKKTAYITIIKELIIIIIIFYFIGNIFKGLINNIYSESDKNDHSQITAKADANLSLNDNISTNSESEGNIQEEAGTQ
ncbi:MAG TPA: hypothetical protein PLL17_05925 [Defluviitaleaceae bacterium]|nr:hypothetical protein [Candidatus Epulonipiscium sp.]HOQ16478.1 hypothetical protein [Defluviitaleaceae bacterium]HPT75254.1 hypothetical protein [Defluviitaleaceae bacterium]HQD50652.1 hypothetical protein [Defluviitaleaceae bacterium]